jgi:hypothetical protein
MLKIFYCAAQQTNFQRKQKIPIFHFVSRMQP